MRTKVLGTACLFALLVVSASAQTTVRANIPFAFTAAGKVLPAGQYEFLRQANDTTIRVTGSAKGSSAVAMVVTRLAASIHTTPQDAHVVFDKVGEQHFLSEIWIPGVDGFLLYSTKGKHEHEVVDVPSR